MNSFSRRAFAPELCHATVSDSSPPDIAVRSRPGAGCKPARGHRTRPAIRDASRTASDTLERELKLDVTVTVTNVNENETINFHANRRTVAFCSNALKLV